MQKYRLGTFDHCWWSFRLGLHWLHNLSWSAIDDFEPGPWHSVLLHLSFLPSWSRFDFFSGLDWHWIWHSDLSTLLHDFILAINDADHVCEVLNRFLLWKIGKQCCDARLEKLEDLALTPSRIRVYKLVKFLGG